MGRSCGSGARGRGRRICETCRSLQGCVPRSRNEVRTHMMCFLHYAVTVKTIGILTAACINSTTLLSEQRTSP